MGDSHRILAIRIASRRGQQESNLPTGTTFTVRIFLLQDTVDTAQEHWPAPRTWRRLRQECWEWLMEDLVKGSLTA